MHPIFLSPVCPPSVAFLYWSNFQDALVTACGGCREWAEEEKAQLQEEAHSPIFTPSTPLLRLADFFCYPNELSTSEAAI